MTPTEKAARWYCTEGYSVIPIRADASKKPLVKWEQYQKEKPLLQQIEEWWGKWPDANIGLVTGEISGISVVDKDLHKMTPEQKAETAKLLPPENTPTANSISGGEHVYYQYHADIPQTAGLIPHVDTRNNGGYIIAPPSAINGRKYLWQTGKAINKIPLAIINPHTLSLFLSSTSIYARARGNEGNVVTSGNITFKEGGRDNALFHLAHCLTGRMPEEEIEQYLAFIASHCDPPFPPKEIFAKIQSAMNRADSKQKSIAQEVREFIEVTDGKFHVTEASRAVTMVTNNNKAILMELSRLVKRGLIERVDQAGVYRKVSDQFKAIHLNDLEDGDLIDLRLPFGMEQYLEIMPKDLIVFAGVYQSGKTAIMLETTRLNMRRHKCYYFSSEMGAHNAKRRIGKHQTCTDWPFEFVDDFANFVDVIQPDCINFIDYVEETDGEAFKIPGILAKIQRKLRKGIAIVALQKNPDKDYAIGGYQTKAKPALFVTIDPDFPGNIMRIAKAKNFMDIDPNGFRMKFKIVQGINLLPKGSWEPE